MKRPRDVIDLTDDEAEQDLLEVLELSPYSQSTSSQASRAVQAVPDNSRGYTIWQAPPSPSSSPMRRAPAMSVPALNLDQQEEKQSQPAEEAEEDNVPVAVHPTSNVDIKFLERVLALNTKQVHHSQ